MVISDHYDHYLCTKSGRLHSCVYHIPVYVKFLSEWAHLVQPSA